MDLIDRLYQKIKEDPLSSKMLIVASYSQGHQSLEQIANVSALFLMWKLRHFRACVHANTAFELSCRKIRFLKAKQVFWVVRQLMLNQAEADPCSYITQKSMVNAGVVRKVHQSLVELRIAGVRSGEIHEREEACISNNCLTIMQKLIAGIGRYVVLS
ncbi:hypothetical protein MHI43_05265 [Paenibacillus sp. FSL H8-0457]|uniref:hypothetical protein n=1 Tax=unclassified Paenibacillus TaxID=185978 RepID=UPI0003E2B671|nr:hypothetical protein [Paenibacillus sp. FSL H8-457]ETT65653.1 hypothetical protein C172_11401 [Paenibacillus sp. FSL H8-457]